MVQSERLFGPKCCLYKPTILLGKPVFETEPIFFNSLLGRNDFHIVEGCNYFAICLKNFGHDS